MIAGAADLKLVPRRRPATSRSNLDPYHRSHLNPAPNYSGPTSTVISFHSSGLPDPTLDASNSPKPPAAGYQCSARRAHRLDPFPFSHRRLRRSHLPTRGSLSTPDPRRWKGDDRDDDIATHFFISSHLVTLRPTAIRYQAQLPESSPPIRVPLPVTSPTTSCKPSPITVSHLLLIGAAKLLSTLFSQQSSVELSPSCLANEHLVCCHMLARWPSLLQHA